MSIPTRSAELSSGWSTLLAATLAYGSTSPLFSYTGHYFIIPLEQATGWSRGQIALGTSIYLLLVAMMLPIVGALTDRIGPVKIGIFSVIGFAASVSLFSIIPEELYFFYAVMAVAAFFVPGTSVVVYARLIALQFTRLRGTAIAIMLSGTAIVLFPLAPVLTQILEDNGWRAGYLVLAAIALVVGLPMTYFAGRRFSQSQSVKQAKEELPGLGFKQALMTSVYWRLVIAIIAAAIPLGGFLNQMSPVLISKGLSLADTAFLGAMFVIAIVVGRTVVGILLDTLNPALVSAVVMLLAAVAMLIFAVEGPSFVVALILVASFGVAMGAEGDLQAFFTARFFGFASYSSILGSVATFLTLGLAGGAVLYGVLYDWYGTYDVAIAISIALYVIAAGSFAALFRTPAFNIEQRPAEI